MAEASISQDQFSCPVCLDLLKDPVTIPCGHSYCMSCITDCWNQVNRTRVYRCPQCRKTFTPRPALCKNVIVAEVVEKLKKRKLRAAHCYAGPEDVECDVCTGRKFKAVKSCLDCPNSYCQDHLEQHENHFKDRGHNLMDPTRRLHEMLCPQHKKHLDIYCRTDQQCICYLCTLNNHKNHDVVAPAAERTGKQKLLEETQKKFQQNIQERVKELQVLREAVKTHKCSAETAVKESERIFTELIRTILRCRSEVIQLIRDREKAAVSRAEDVLKQLEKEIGDLKRRNAELEQLLHTNDDIYFLQCFQSLSAAPQSTVSNSITVSSAISFDDVRNSVFWLKEKLEDYCGGEIEMISEKVTYVTVTSHNEPKTRNDFLQYFRQFTLDTNTMHKRLRQFDGNRAATYTHTVQQYADHPDRFGSWRQVLCRERVCGRCYWEVKWSGKCVYISVSYKSISRKGSSNECGFGFNDQSWSLSCSSSGHRFGHNDRWTDVPVPSSSSRIGVYVDQSAGTLSFYSVSDKMTLIHSVRTTFTKPLYPGFYVNVSSLVKVCNLIK